jgi:hypothetical protein
MHCDKQWEINGDLLYKHWYSVNTLLSLVSMKDLTIWCFCFTFILWRAPEYNQQDDNLVMVLLRVPECKTVFEAIKLTCLYINFYILNSGNNNTS